MDLIKKKNRTQQSNLPPCIGTINTMNRRSLILSCALAYLAIVQSFQLDHHPRRTKQHPSLTQLHVGFRYNTDPSHWSDVFPHKEQPSATKKTAKLSPIESAWTKYGMISYIAHMCAFLPLSLLPTLLQTKLGWLDKTESEHQALQVGQKCAQTLLWMIPFMNVGKL